MEDAVDVMGQGSSRPQYQMLSTRAGYLGYPFQNQEVTSRVENLNTCAGYLAHPFSENA